jgi:hypothetical protein
MVNILDIFGLQDIIIRKLVMLLRVPRAWVYP